MGFLKSKKGSIISDYFKLLEPVGNYEAGNMYDVALYDDHLEISGKKNVITLDYSQITDVFYGLQTQLVEKSKSVIGRAVVGGILFGGIGATVGAISGVGKKEKKENHFCFIVSYISSKGEDKFLQFEDTRLYKGRKVANKLKELTGISDGTGKEGSGDIKL